LNKKHFLSSQVPEPVRVEEESEDEEIITNPPTDGERVMTSWPPRNPGGSGLMPKPESVKKKEDDLNQKWEMPQPPTSAGQQTPVQKLPLNVQRMQTSSVKNDESANPAKPSQPTTTPQDNSKKHPKQIEKQQQDVGSSNQTQATHDAQTQPRNSKPTNEGECRAHGAESKVASSAPNSQQSHDNQTLQANQSNQNNEGNEPVAKDLATATTPPRNRGLSGGTPKGSPSKFDVDQMPVYCLDSQYQNVSFQMPTEFEHRIFNPPVPMATIDHASSMAIGKIGEEIVFRYFHIFYKDSIKAGEIEIVWLNEEEETGQPYDLIVKHHPIQVEEVQPQKKKKKKKDQSSGNKQQQHPDIYIEVKTTVANEEKQFEISSQQLKFAIEHGPNFHLYRVSGLATQPEFRLRSLKNLANHMDKKAVKMYMVL